MSILVEIAGKADVSVEGVVRVLTREPVSSAVKERVLAVLDQLDGEQTRVLERFALAAVHDVVPLEPEDELAPPDEPDDSPSAVHEGQLAIGESPPPQHPTFVQPPAGTGLDRHLDTDLPVGLGTLLEELVSAVWEMRHERRSDRQERLDDLAVLVDLMTTSWQGVDRRLARLEQLLARREANWHTPVPAVAPVEPPPLLQRVPEPPAEPPPPADDEPASTRRSWPPFAGTLLLVASLVGVMLVFDLLPSRAEGPSFLPASENGSVPPPATGTGSSGTQSQATQPVSTQPATTTQPGATRPGATQSGTTPPGATRPSQPARTTAPARSTQQAPAAPPPQRPPRGTTTGAATQAAPPTTTGTSAIQPARVFVWPPFARAEGYSVRFFREGDAFYSARVTEPRLTIPKRIVFRPGTYRWVVLPDRGPLGLGEPIIDSSFTVARP